MGCPRPPFASFLRLACRPRAPLEEPELVARRKELQSERLRLRPEIQELLVLGGSRAPRPADTQLVQHLRRAAQVLLGVQALALDPGGQRFVPAQLCSESFHGCGPGRHVRPVLGHGRCPYTAAPKGLQRDYPRFLRRLSWPRITPVFAPTAASRVRRISSVVEMPGTSGMRSTRPPRARVSSRPAISSSGQSAPFTRPSGARAAPSARALAASKTITRSTAARPASTSARSSAHRIGRPGPFSRRTEASPFSPTTSTSPSARAAAR